MVAKAEAMIAAYKRVLSLAEACSETEQRVPPQTWNPPQDGFVKLNIDAAINSKKNLVGLGAMIRDDLGHVQQLQSRFPSSMEMLLMLRQKLWNGVCWW